MTRTAIALASSAGVLLLWACSGPSQGGKVTDPPVQEGSSEPPPASALKCESDSDCVVVETQCCDHCNGGKALAFNKDNAAAKKPSGCEGKVCTMMACDHAVAVCKDSQCRVEMQSVRPTNPPPS
jgi:hypothetical protein